MNVFFQQKFDGNLEIQIKVNDKVTLKKWSGKRLP